MLDPFIGKQLGDYIIQDLLGKGGMARVYKGFDDRLQRFAAVKVINPELASGDQAEYAERFRREARSIARLHHPNIVGVYQFGEYDGSYYMAMVFIEGRDLREILKDYAEQGRRMSYDEILNVIRGICSALDYAHSRGVIHRDIKPSNIMMDSENRPILTDFGLALNTQEGTLGDTFGSAHYIAPEQAVSSAKAVPQSDLYSLGIVLYEMLVGKVPFDDPSAMSVALKHLNEPPPSPRLANPDIPVSVERVIFKMLDKDPNQRFPNGAALVQGLEAALSKSASDSTVELDSRKVSAQVSPEMIDRLLSMPPSTPKSGTSPLSGTGPLSGTSPSSRTPLRKPNDDEDNISTFIGTAAGRSQQGSRSGLIIGGTVVILLLLAIIGLFASGVLGGGGSTTPTSVAANTTPVSTAAATAVVTPAATSAETATPTQAATATTAETQAVTPAATAIATTPSTAAPTAAATQAGTAVAGVGAGPSVLLLYDDTQFVLLNTSVSTINLSALELVQHGDTDATTRRWNVSLWDTGAAFNSTSALQPKYCFQAHRGDAGDPPMPFPDCPIEPRSFRAAWTKAPEANQFWIARAGQQNATFEVSYSGTVVATCTISAKRCEFALPVAASTPSSSGAAAVSSPTPQTPAQATETATTTSTATSSPTVQPTTAVPTASVKPSIVLIYDDTQLILVNVSDKIVNIDELQLIQPAQTGGTPRRWNMSMWESSGAFNRPAALQPKYCFQAYRGEGGEPPTPFSECPIEPRSLRAAWVKAPENNQFWVPPKGQTEAQFDAILNGKTLATCSTSAKRCEIALP